MRDTDAEGPLELASNYEEMLGDTVTAVELLRKAWRIDPNSKEVAEAFRLRGYRKVRDEWVLAVQEQGGRATGDQAGRRPISKSDRNDGRGSPSSEWGESRTTSTIWARRAS